MQHYSLVFAILLLTAHYTYATEETSTELPSGNSFQSFGSDIRDVVARTFTICGYELFGLGQDLRETNGERSTLCSFLLRPLTDVGRGHYGGGGASYNTSGFDPLTLLAGLAFLAFLLQTLHALLYRQTASISSLGLSRKVTESPAELEHAVGRALDRYELLNSHKRMTTENAHWPWPFLPRIVRSITTSYAGPRTRLPCNSNPLCISSYHGKQLRTKS